MPPGILGTNSVLFGFSLRWIFVLNELHEGYLWQAAIKKNLDGLSDRDAGENVKVSVSSLLCYLFLCT